MKDSIQTFFLCNHIDGFSKAVTVYNEYECEKLLKQYGEMADAAMKETGKSIFYGLVRRHPKTGTLVQADFFIVPIGDDAKPQINEFYGVRTHQHTYIRHYTP